MSDDVAIEKIPADEVIAPPIAGPVEQDIKDCKAKPISGGRTRCESCEMTWHRDEQRPYCDPVTLGRMRIEAADAADQIEAFQKRQVDGGFIAQPNWQEMRRVVVFRRMANLFRRIADDPDIVAALKGKRGNARE